MCGGCVEEGGADSDQANHNKEKVNLVKLAGNGNEKKGDMIWEFGGILWQAIVKV
jgi:hypothetical protein